MICRRLKIQYALQIAWKRVFTACFHSQSILIGKAQNKKVDMIIVSRNVNSVTGMRVPAPQYACVFGLAKLFIMSIPDSDVKH
jgi:hypothetical protein